MLVLHPTSFELGISSVIFYVKGKQGRLIKVTYHNKKYILIWHY